MTREELFALYKRVQQKDRAAEDELIRAHKALYPRSSLNKQTRGDRAEYRTNLHIMYSHLYRKAKK